MDVCYDVWCGVGYGGIVGSEDVEFGMGVVVFVWCVEGVGDVLGCDIVYWYWQCFWWCYL